MGPGEGPGRVLVALGQGPALGTLPASLYLHIPGLSEHVHVPRLPGLWGVGGSPMFVRDSRDSPLFLPALPQAGLSLGAGLAPATPSHTTALTQRLRALALGPFLQRFLVLDLCHLAPLSVPSVTPKCF